MSSIFWYLWYLDNGYDYAKHFRSLPLPYTGRRHYHRGCTMRLPRTRAEERENIAVLCDEELRELGIRVRENRLMLPDAWDDKGRADIGIRSWKRHRRHQWK